MGEPVAERRGKDDRERQRMTEEQIVLKREEFRKALHRLKTAKEARHPPALERKRSQGLLTHHHCVNATVPSCGISDLAIR